ncbi:kinase-like domain-containing protein [Rhizophagus clarus]|nr:kinase-like domain-containing protein [Rhizophagus clarus]
MELANINDENSFDPTPKLKSSPIPINFVSFDENDYKCVNCEENYIFANYCYQKYCRKCLLNYLTKITDNNTYLDVYIFTRNLDCSEHEISREKEPQNIQECCRNCLEILCFKQISKPFIYNVCNIGSYGNMIKSEVYCKQCGKFLYQGADFLEMTQFRLCSDCYLISTGYIDPILTKRSIPIIYLPWWDNIYSCIVCIKSLIFTSDCQKYCENCLIFYIGCRYCLTTNIIFGLTTHSQCKKCKRISSIIFDITSILSGNNDLDDFVINLRPEIYNNLRIDEFSDKIMNDEYFLPSKISSTIQSICQNYKNTQSKDQSEKLIEWIPFSQFTNVVEIARGEFGITYFHATLVQKSAILKKFKNSQDFGKYVLNELKSNQYCYEIKNRLIRFHGVTKDPKLGDYILVTRLDSHNWFMSQKESSISYVENYKHTETSKCIQDHEMDLIKLTFFDPTPKLKSSLIPIKFISFNEHDHTCIYCEEEYIETLLYKQKYCKKCLSSYLAEITDINLYLDLYIFTQNLGCSKKEISRIKEPQNILECSRNFSDILYFRQILADDNFYLNNSGINECNLYDDMIENEKFCKLCGKSLYQERISNFILCSDCYLISSEYIKLTEKSIPIIYLPWWHNVSYCTVCRIKLLVTSDCQKYCENCLTFYIGCRYCLTTNIIYGLTTQSQCRKCERISSIIAVNILSGNSNLDDFLVNLSGRYDNLRMDEISDKTNNNDKYYLPSEINSTIESICQNCQNYKSTQSEKIMMEWIPYSQFMDVEEIARGGFGIIYRATWTQKNAILKKFKDSQDTSKYFLNELKSNQNCYEIKHHIIRTHGVTKDPKSGDFMLVMQYASGGDLHNWLQKKFAEITWNKDKLIILWQISEGLETIHKSNYIHRDFHSGNILYDLLHNSSKFKERHQWLIGDLGLSQPANNTSNNEIYGVIPYIAPEIFKGFPFSKESDVYSMGMIMWELTTGCKPFADVEHDINLIFKILDGERPKITEDTPKCYMDLMKSCWDPDPIKRPSAKMIRNTFGSWAFRNKNKDIFIKAELKRIELLKLERLGPKFNKNLHSKAIYTSRLLSPFISICSSIDSSLFGSNKHVYISKELGLDIKIESEPLIVPTALRKRKIEELNIENDDK